MRLTVLVLLLIVVFSLRSLALGDQDKKPDEIKDSRFPDGQFHDFGKVAMGALVKHTFRIVNTSEFPVEITSVRGRSIRASMDKTKLNPKDEGKLEIALDTRLFVGEKTITIFVTVQTGKAQVEQYSFLVRCNSDKDVKLDPKIRLQNRLMEAACKGVSIERDGLPPAPGVYLGDDKTPDIVSVLKEGADVNGRDQRGDTALMVASTCGLADNVKTLLANGADATLKNDGWTPLMFAEAGHPWRVEGRREVGKILRDHLARKR